MQTRVKNTSPRSGVRRAKSNQSIKMIDEITSKNRYNHSVRKISPSRTNTTDVLDWKQKQSASKSACFMVYVSKKFLSS